MACSSPRWEYPLGVPAGSTRWEEDVGDGVWTLKELLQSGSAQGKGTVNFFNSPLICFPFSIRIN
jgi:hypothetical protein